MGETLILAEGLTMASCISDAAADYPRTRNSKPAIVVAASIS